MIAACVERARIPVFVIIRPRGGDFIASDDELNVMWRDIETARWLGARGVVFGLLRANGTVDAERVAPLIEVAGAMGVTFHRAFDHCRDLDEALETLVELGVERVLTSGG